MKGKPSPLPDDEAYRTEPPQAVIEMYKALLPFEKVLPDYDYEDTPYTSTGIDDKSLIGIDALKRAAMALKIARKQWPQLQRQNKTR